MFSFGLKVVVRSFNLSVYLAALSYVEKNYKICQIFDSTMYFLEALNINLSRLERVRNKIFDRRKSQGSSYTVDNLVCDLGDTFGQKRDRCCLVTSFVTLVIRHFCRINYLN